MDISVPCTTTLITIRGAQWLHFSRLAFIDTTTLWQGYMGSASHQPSTGATSVGRSNEGTAAGWPDCAIRVEDGSAQITFSNSDFEQLGGCGIAIRGEVESVQVIGCLFASVAAHGILVHGFEGTLRISRDNSVLLHCKTKSPAVERILALDGQSQRPVAHHTICCFMATSSLGSVSSSPGPPL